MKHIFFSIVFLTFSVCSSAQTPTEYSLCSELQPLEGEWMYQNGQQQIKMYLRYHRMTSYAVNFGTTNNTVNDVLIGWIEYKINGSIVESTYQDRFMSLDPDFNQIPYLYSLMLSPKITNVCFPNILSGYIIDIGHARQRKNVDATISHDIINTTMTWKQSHQTGYGAFNGDYGMTLPPEFVLIKQ